MRSLGVAEAVLPSSLRPLDRRWVLAGPIYTISGHLSAEATEHDTLLGWSGMLSDVPTGSVVVCQPDDSTLAHMGELSAEVLQKRGIRGYVVDGGCRDVAVIRRLGFPVFCRYVTPADIVGRWLIDRCGDPIRIGDVKIRTGDYVIADEDGIVVVPEESAEAVVRSAEKLVSTETALRKALRDGMDPKQAYLRFGVF